jgi:hypothetical protein
MYPELITRPDIKVFLPPIGGLTVYICESPPLCHLPDAHIDQLATLRTCGTSRRSLPFAFTTSVSTLGSLEAEFRC